MNDDAEEGGQPPQEQNNGQQQQLQQQQDDTSRHGDKEDADLSKKYPKAQSLLSLYNYDCDLSAFKEPEKRW